MVCSSSHVNLGLKTKSSVSETVLEVRSKVEQLARERKEAAAAATAEKLSAAGHVKLTPQERLKAFYEEHNPEKLESVDSTLVKYVGREEVLFSMLAEKYGAAVPEFAPGNPDEQGEAESVSAPQGVEGEEKEAQEGGTQEPNLEGMSFCKFQERIYMVHICIVYVLVLQGRRQSSKQLKSWRRQKQQLPLKWTSLKHKQRIEQD